MFSHTMSSHGGRKDKEALFDTNPKDEDSILMTESLPKGPTH